jgi:phosphate transport system substrate-binding protein
MTALSAHSVFAQAASTGFDPQPVAAGTLRIWGDPYMVSVVDAWQQRFRFYHPEAQFEVRLLGTDTAMPALYGGIADLALFGRESNTTENDGFLHSLQYKPLQLRLMTGSLDSPGKSHAPVLFVRKQNPLAKLTLAQVDALFGCGQGRPSLVRTWGELGLGGEWKDRPVHLYMPDIDSGTGVFVLRKLQGESRKMNWEIIREFADSRHPDGTVYEAAEQAMDALKADPYGLAVSSLHYASDDVKALALASVEGGPYVQASRETVIDGSYPLARRTYVFVNPATGQAVAPLVKEFLRFVYSGEGQKLVAAEPGFLPLTAQDAALQIKALQ